MLKKNSAVNNLIAFVALCFVFVSSASAQNAAATSPLSAQQITAKVDEYMNAAVRLKALTARF